MRYNRQLNTRWFYNTIRSSIRHLMRETGCHDKDKLVKQFGGFQQAIAQQVIKTISRLN